jgi:hypothetical protein
VNATRRLVVDPRFALGVVAVALALSPALAAAQPLVSESTQIGTWALAIIKALAVVFIIGGCLAVAAGRHYGGALIAVLGVIAAAKADTIASFFGI